MLTTTTWDWSAIAKNPLDWVQKLSADEYARLLMDAAALYYEGAPVLTDAVFDLLQDEFRRLFPSHPYLHIVGAPPAALAHNKVKLPFFMGSLDKIRDDPSATAKFMTKYPGSYLISDKLDGNSALLFLTPQNKWELYSRGDGSEGQSLAHIIPYLHLPTPAAGAPVLPRAVRGELIMSKEDWHRLQHKGANMRNVVAGALHATKTCDPEVAAAIHFVAYEQIHPAPATPEEGLENLHATGFEVVNSRIVTHLDTQLLSELLLARREESPYEIDGLVITHNASHKRPTSGNPKYAFAFKTLLTHDQAEVTVTHVEWNVSKDRYLKPIIHFQPVPLAGAQIQKATGFHARFIEENKIGPGARLIIVRSGDVIPHVHQVISGAPFPSLPDINYEWNATHTDIFLTESNDDVTLKRLVHFAATLKIRGLAEKTVAKLFEGGIRGPAALLAASKVTLQTLLSPKVGESIYDEIQRVRNTASLVDYAVASNIFGRGFSHKRMKLIFSAASHPRELTLQKIEGLDGIGSITAAQFMEALPDFLALLADLPQTATNAPVAPAPALASAAEQKLAGSVVVFTGFRDKELEARVEALGGRVATSMSSKTTHLVAKDCSAASSKIQKALEAGVKCLNRLEFENLISA